MKIPHLSSCARLSAPSRSGLRSGSASFAMAASTTEDVTAVLGGYDTTLTYEKAQDACRLLCRESKPLVPNALRHPFVQLDFQFFFCHIHLFVHLTLPVRIRWA